MGVVYGGPEPRLYARSVFRADGGTPVRPVVAIRATAGGLCIDLPQADNSTRCGSGKR